MSGALPPSSIVDAPGNGSGQMSAATRLGFVVEPIVDLIHLDARALYSECLARMIVAKSILLKGGDFVSDLEARGAIGALDAAIVDLVLDALADDPRLHLGCNVSPRTLADRASWADLMRRIRRRAWLAPRLAIEITESAPLDEIPDAADRLRSLRALGCRIVIDDFGAGYATSARLRRLAIEWDVIKLDRSCFGDFGKAPAARGGLDSAGARSGDLRSDHLRSVVSRAASLAPVVVVEGIETPEHLVLARDAGARYGQGWMFDGPAHVRWCVPDAATGAKLAAAMVLDGAVIRLALERPDIAASGAAINGGINGELGDSSSRGLGPGYFLSRVCTIRDRVRALIVRATAGGAA